MVGKNFMGLSYDTKSTSNKRKKINWISSESKTFMQKKTLPKWKDLQHGRKYILANHMFDTGVISRVFNKLLQFNNKKTTQLKMSKGHE